MREKRFFIIIVATLAMVCTSCGNSGLVEKQVVFYQEMSTKIDRVNTLKELQTFAEDVQEMFSAEEFKGVKLTEKEAARIAEARKAYVKKTAEVTRRIIVTEQENLARQQAAETE